MRPYTDNELRNCVGKRVVDTYENVVMITAYRPGSPADVRIGGVWVSAVTLFNQYMFTDAGACGRPEYKGGTK